MQNERPVIAVTIVPEETFVKAVCGDAFDVQVMIPPGSSPETYEPTVKQKAAVEKAKLYFSIGVPAEKAVLPSVTAPIVDLHEKVSAVYPDLKLGNERDPHIWLSVRRVAVMIDVITEEATRLMPDRKAFFAANATAYKGQLEAADGIHRLSSRLRILRRRVRAHAVRTGGGGKGGDAAASVRNGRLGETERQQSSVLPSGD
jgi:zinc transport system substrate-binding protein